jgi:hypothetical protein
MAAIEITTTQDFALPTPVALPKPPGGPVRLKERGGDLVLPTQEGPGGLIAVIPSLKAGQKRVFEIQPGGAQQQRINLKDEGGSVTIRLPEGAFSTYHYGKDAPRPYLYPVLGPGGKAVTRNFPMMKIAGEDMDHPHHRSFWTAYGEVNGVDDWSEEPKHGFIRHEKFEMLTGGPVWGGFTAKALWTGPDDKPLLDELRTFRIYDAGPDYRLVDYDVKLSAAYGDLHYGNTKEGGLLAFRVATSMDGNKGGKMENSSGAVGEKDIWGKRANWLDYSGPVDGQVMGIGMMDHPGNWAHPCRWHARDYGLVGTNPFANAAFEKGASAEGHTQKSGESLLFRYRVLFHKGDAKQGMVDAAYHAWIDPPKARMI